MYQALNLLSLILIALGICYTAFYGIMAAKGGCNGAGLVAIVFVSLLFIVALILRALSDIGTRLIRLENLAGKQKE